MVTPKWGPPPLLMASTLLSLGGHEDISQCFFLRKTIIPEMLPDSKEDPLPSHHLQACQRATFNSASSVPWLTTLQLSPHSPFCTQCSVPVLGTGSPSHRYCIITARDSSIIPTCGFCLQSSPAALIPCLQQRRLILEQHWKEPHLRLGLLSLEVLLSPPPPFCIFLVLDPDLLRATF
jgi:hypothetical protein